MTMNHFFSNPGKMISLCAGIAIMGLTSLANAADAKYTVPSASSAVKVLSIANSLSGQAVIGFAVSASIDQTTCIPASQGKLCLADVTSNHKNYGENRFSEFVTLPYSTNHASATMPVMFDMNVPAPIAYGEVEWTVKLCVQGC